MCYQIPALMLEGTALVVSPLISLMKDQVAALIANGVRAAYLNSSLTPGQMERALENARRGCIKSFMWPRSGWIRQDFCALPSRQNFPHRRGRGALRQPMGPGFPPQLSEDCRLCGRLPTATGGRVHGHGDASGPGGYSSPASAGKPQVSVTGFDRPNLYFEVLRPKNASKPWWNCCGSAPSTAG